MAFKVVSVIAAAAALVGIRAPAQAQTAQAGDNSNKATLPPASAPATDAPVSTSPFTITGGAAIVSQYRFRGISQSDNKPVVQGTFTVAHSSGFYVSVWGSSASANN